MPPRDWRNVAETQAAGQLPGMGNSMVTYLSVEAARPLSGLRLAVTAHVPGIWSEAAKGLFDAKKIPYTLVEQVVGGENRALKEWTAQTSGPVAVWNDERPRSSWLELIYLAERLAPEPALIPPKLEDRVLMFGLCNELAGDHGFGWNVRLTAMHKVMADSAATEYQNQVVPVLAKRYGYDAESVAAARRQMIAIVSRLQEQLALQNAAGRGFLVGEGLSALDIYWATFAGAIDPLLPELCPNMPPEMRAGYTDPELKALAGPALFALRDRVYRDYLKLPMEF
jgi:glutathione S-transferase